MPKVKDRNGEEFVSKQGDKVKIVNYKKAIRIMSGIAKK